MASNEFKACKKQIAKAISRDEIQKAVDILDEQWRDNENIMKDKDWPRLVKLISGRLTKI